MRTVSADLWTAFRRPKYLPCTASVYSLHSKVARRGLGKRDCIESNGWFDSRGETSPSQLVSVQGDFDWRNDADAAADSASCSANWKLIELDIRKTACLCRIRQKSPLFGRSYKHLRILLWITRLLPECVYNVDKIPQDSAKLIWRRPRTHDHNLQEASIACSHNWAAFDQLALLVCCWRIDRQVQSRVGASKNTWRSKGRDGRKS